MNSASEQADSARQKEEEEEKKLGGIWGSHGGEYEDGCLLGCSTV
jgi:hypothetical protein